MKKLLSILLIAVMLFVMCMFGGCNSANYGTFYSLEEAYENGYLTQEDLLSIAYYYNGGREGNEHLMPENYSPKPIEPQELSNRIVRKIKNTYKWDLFKQDKIYLPNPLIDLYSYYGEYNDCYLIMITDLVIKHCYWPHEYVIGNVYFLRYTIDFVAWIEN